MLSAEELEWLNVALKEIDGLLRGMADFRQFPDLLQRDDARLDALAGARRRQRARRAPAQRQGHGARRPCASGHGRGRPPRRRGSPAHRGRPPASRRSPVPVPTVRPPANIEQITMANPAGMRELVLVAEHNGKSLQEIETMLTDEDYRVLSVQDAFEAVSIYARLWAAIDLVILDFSMPGLSGDLLFDELQGINPTWRRWSAAATRTRTSSTKCSDAACAGSCPRRSRRSGSSADQAGARPPRAHAAWRTVGD